MARLWRDMLSGLAALLASSFVATAAQGADDAKGAAAFSPDSIAFFESRVRPVLVQQCQSCHKRDGKRSGGLALDAREAILEGGDSGPAIDLEKPAESVLVLAVKHDESLGLAMPPKKKLTDREIADLEEWIRRGAPWPADATTRPASPQGRVTAEDRAFWSFRPLERPAIPATSSRDAASSIDTFINAKLAAAGIEPSPPADKRALVRRLFLDLIGLPPSPAEVAAFLEDSSPDAYERLVDRLLASPHFGERWGRHWLDVVRFAETNGHEFDEDKPDAWRYRDYVTEAFNTDLPFDQFAREHVAGDLVGSDRLSVDGQLAAAPIATGFWWFGELLNSPIDGPAARADQVENQLDVFGKAFLGLSMGCCRCHDHKFDPLFARDYYALAGFIYSSQQGQAWIDAPAIRDQTRDGIAAAQVIDRQMLESVRARLTKVVPPNDELLKALAPALTRLIAGDAAAPALSEASQKWRNVLGTLDGQGLLADALVGPAKPPRSETEVVYEDFESADLAKWRRSGPSFLVAPTPPRVRFVSGRLDRQRGVLGKAAIDSGVAGDRLMGYLSSRPFKIEKRYLHAKLAGGGDPRRTGLQVVIEDYAQPGCMLSGGNGADLTWRSIDLARWVGQEAFIQIVDRAADASIQVDEIVFSDKAGPPNRPARSLADVAKNSPPSRIEEWASRLAKSLLASLSGKESDLDTVAALVALDLAYPAKESESGTLLSLAKERAKIERAMPLAAFAWATTDAEPIDVNVHVRGNVHQPGALAPRRFLELLDARPLDSKNGSGRRELAERLVDRGNPLLPRVIANRLWHYHFGAGLVATPNDFGKNSEPPSNPELLDYLAGRVLEENYRLKPIHRMIVLSAAYQRSNQPTASAKEKDPTNKLWARRTPRRLEAESLRDAMLAVSGRLDRRLYGQSVAPHLTAYMDGRGRPGASGPLDGDRRRSTYIQIRRNFLTPMFLAFDYPAPLASIGKRSVSTVPSQALLLLNNAFVQEEARAWGDRVAAKGSLEAMFEEAFSRPATDAEIADARSFLSSQVDRYRGQGLADADRRAWGDLAHVLFNAVEFQFAP